ncbi:MAG: EAL domain-containing protein [Lachnospiraceae bacterium]|nr:EAL domain-containing protein [Lachnospiraceae bacterium]
MKDIKKKKLNRLKFSYAAGSFTGFVFVTLLIFVAFAVMLSVFGLYIADSKIRDENFRAQKQAAVYESAEKTGNEEVYALINEPGNDYIIIDESGKIIGGYGNNTCDLKSGGTIDVLALAQEVGEEIHDNMNIDIGTESAVTVYPDTQLRMVTPGVNGRIRIDMAVLMSTLTSRATYNAVLSSAQGDFVRLPFWIDVPISGGRHMVCKAYFSVYFRELKIFGLLASVIVLLSIITLICIIVYICKNIRYRRKVNELFFMDELTGKHNWPWFVANAEKIIRKSGSSGRYAILDVVFVNYRNFCVCHSVKEGENMLRSVYSVLEHNAGKKELIAHHSAAHFAMMLTFHEKDYLEDRIRRIISELENINNEHKFSFWVGVDMVGSTVDGKITSRRNIDIEREYNNAGAARATITGDDSAIAFFDDKIVEEQKWIDMINENQDKALENEEFLVYYQPKYDPRTNELKGAEALIRWNSPVHGMISPGRFIPIFEKNGFITKIDHYMLSHVAKDQRAWLDSGYKCVPVSVNVSRSHFIESDLAEQIRDIVDLAGTPHDLIELELTESAFFDDKNAMIATIKRLKEYGFTVSMDDFGAGYSSLNSLKEMPLDVLKLDADFFRNDGADGRGRIVVTEAIKLARNLNMRTVAEGIEDRDQVDFLAEQGCDMIQGFYFAKPMPKDDYMQKMSNGSKDAGKEDTGSEDAVLADS